MLPDNDATLFRKVFDQAPEMILLTDAVTGVIVECNAAASKILGWSREELAGRSQRSLHPDIAQQGEFTDSFLASLEDDQAVATQLTARDGTVLDVIVRTTLMEHQGRKLLLGVFHNDTERRRYEKRIWDLSRFPEENPNPVLRVTADGSILFANGVSCSVLEKGGCSLNDTLPEVFRKAIAAALQSGEPQSLDMQHGDRHFHYTLAPIMDAGYVNVYGMDITARKEADQALARSEKRYRIALQAANLGSWDADLVRGEILWSETIESVFGMAPGSFGGTFQDFIDLVHPGDKERVQAAITAALEQDKEYNEEYRIHPPGGVVRWMRGMGAVFRDEQGAPIRMSGVVQDITDQREALSRIEYLALHDSLTGLYNREAFLDHLDKALAQSRRNNKRVALLFLDLDGFKGVNDKMGHLAGDAVLKEVAQRMLGAIRDMDMAARLGGDEFALLLPDLDDMDFAQNVARRILESVSRPVQVQGKECTLSASIGIAVSPDHASDVQSLIKCSDKAMYMVKNSGRNGWATCPLARAAVPAD